MASKSLESENVDAFDYFERNSVKVLKEATPVTKLLEGEFEEVADEHLDYLKQFAVYKLDDHYMLIDTKERNLQLANLRDQDLEDCINQYLERHETPSQNLELDDSSSDVREVKIEGELVLRMENPPKY